MANELQAYLPTGMTLYAVLLDAAGQVWDGTQFEVIAAGTWTDNKIALAEATAGIYLADMPVDVAGAYSYIVYEQAGASPAVTDTLVGMGSIDWTGTAQFTLLDVKTDIEAVKAKTDLLDCSDVTVVTAVVGSTITVLRGDTFTADLSALGSLADYVSLDFTVKASAYLSDDDAVIRIRKNASGLSDGLLRLNKAAHTIGTDGSLTITDALTGDVTIMLKASVTDDLVLGTYVYDIQLIEASEVSTLTSGVLNVTADVTRLVA